MLRKTLPPELRNLKIAQHPIFAMGLLIAALSLAANIGYWTRGLTGQTYWINFVFAGMVEVMFVFLIWLGGNIWKSGGRALATVLVALSLAPWLASSVTNFMFLATLKEPQIASAQASVLAAKEQVLQSDLTRYGNELSQYADIVRKDVSALEERQAFCDRAPRDECNSLNLAEEIAVNRKINQLEESQTTALASLEAIASERTAAITDTEFSIALLSEKFNGNWLSREFLMVAFLDILKAVLFLVGLWINLRLYKTSQSEHEDQIDLLAQLTERTAALEKLEKSVEAKTKALAAAQQKATASEPKQEQARPSANLSVTARKTVPAAATGLTEQQTTAPTKTTVAKPKATRKKPVASDGKIIEYQERQADGTTITRRKRIA